MPSQLFHCTFSGALICSFKFPPPLPGLWQPGKDRFSLTKLRSLIFTSPAIEASFAIDFSMLISLYFHHRMSPHSPPPPSPGMHGYLYHYNGVLGGHTCFKAVMALPSTSWPLPSCLCWSECMLNTLPQSMALEEDGCSNEQACSVRWDLTLLLVSSS